MQRLFSLSCSGHYTILQSRECPSQLSRESVTNIINRDYATKVFGFATFGRIYGAITCLSGLFNFSQSALDALTHGPLDGNPTPINFAMAVLGTLCGLLLTGWVMYKGREYDQEMQKQNVPVPTQGQVSERLGLIREDTAEYGTIGRSSRDQV